MNEYRFNRHTDGSYVVTTPAGEGWRLLDGTVSTHLRGRVVVVALHGADAQRTADVQRAWAQWWQAQYEN